MANLFSFPKQYIADQSGIPLMGAKLYFYQTGTSTPQNTFTDSSLTEANQNPVQADAYGLLPPIWLSETGPDYRVTVTDSGDVVQWIVDGLLSDSDSLSPAGVLNALSESDGAGSGLDADLLDGLDSTAFGQKAVDETIAGRWNFAPGFLNGGVLGGFAGIPKRSKTAQYTLKNSDNGFCISNTTTGIKIPVNSSGTSTDLGPFSEGHVTCLYNNSAVNQTIVAETPATTTIRLAGTTTTGTRTVAPRGFAVAWYHGTNEWLCWGLGVS